MESDLKHGLVMDEKESESRSLLITQASNGDHVALEKLLLLECSILADYVESRLPRTVQSKISVEDILQETFIGVFRGISSFQPNSENAFGNWIRTIADHRLKDAIRRLNRKKRGGDFQQLAVHARREDSSISDIAAAVCGDSTTPSQFAANKEAIEAVQVSLAGLPEKYRQILQLHYLDRMSIPAIAERIGRTEGVVRGLLDRARKKMRAAMGRSSLYLSR